MALTDPVLTTNNTIVDTAIEALRIYDMLRNEIQEMLPPAETRWRTLCAEMQEHEIRNTYTVAAVSRFGELFAPNSGKRRALEQKQSLSKRWLEDFSAELNEFGNFAARMRPLVERERMREAALDARIQELLRPRKVRLVYRTRLEAVVGIHQNLTMRGYTFQRVTVAEDGEVSVTEQEATSDLIQKFEAAGKKG